MIEKLFACYRDGVYIVWDKNDPNQTLLKSLPDFHTLPNIYRVKFRGGDGSATLHAIGYERVFTLSERHRWPCIKLKQVHPDTLEWTEHTIGVLVNTEGHIAENGEIFTTINRNEAYHKSCTGTHYAWCGATHDNNQFLYALPCQEAALYIVR